MPINTKWDDKEHRAVKHIGYFQPEETTEHISKLGVRVAIVLDNLKGIHNLPSSVLKKVDWESETHIKIAWNGILSTYDNDLLVRLFTLSSLAHLRLQIEPCNPKHIYLTFHLRKTREGGRLFDRIPHPLKQVESIIDENKEWDDNQENIWRSTIIRIIQNKKKGVLLNIRDIANESGLLSHTVLHVLSGLAEKGVIKKTYTPICFVCAEILGLEEETKEIIEQKELKNEYNCIHCMDEMPVVGTEDVYYKTYFEGDYEK